MSALRGYVANTDFDWYRALRERPELEEVNFWQPSGGRGFHAVSPGAPFFFKLKSPYNAIGGFGYFAHASQALPLTVAWEAFGERNGAESLDEMRRRVLKYRRDVSGPNADPLIGCLMISQPTFFADDEWVAVPRDWKPNIVQGKTYDLTVGEGVRLWQECAERARAIDVSARAREEPSRHDLPRYGEAQLVRPRLGQGTFRIAVLDAYGRSCAVTTEHSLPVLESAHIRPYAEGGGHEVSNGLLLRADIHRLYDRGFVTVTPDLRFRVSRRLKEAWHNGRVYYEFDGRRVAVPDLPGCRPDRKQLEWHAEERFLG